MSSKARARKARARKEREFTKAVSPEIPVVGYAPNTRWAGHIDYRTDDPREYMTVPFEVEEISEIAEIVESGPHWDCVVSIHVERVNHCDDRHLTIEKARAL